MKMRMSETTFCLVKKLSLLSNQKCFSNCFTYKHNYGNDFNSNKKRIIPPLKRS